MRNKRRSTAAVLFPLLAIAAPLFRAADARAQDPGAEPIIGGPCEGCEAVFEGLPDHLRSVTRLAPEGEPGAPLRIEGVARDAEGRPVPGVIIYAYHTNAEGVYPRDPRAPGRASSRHGRLRGWAITDGDGRYAFETVRPGTYPSRSDPAHVHMHVIEPGCCTYYIDSIHFADDPLLDSDREAGTPRGGSGIVDPVRTADGTWIVRRDIRLGLGVPGYPTSRR